MQRDLLEVCLGKEFLKENAFFSTLSEMLCNAQKDFYNMKKLIIHSFLEVANEIILSTIVESVGDAIMVKVLQ